MEILYQGQNCIITPLSPSICNYQALKLMDVINENVIYEIGINLDHVIDCSIDFINMINKFEDLNIYNIRPDIFAIFNKMGLDKRVNLYNSEIDFFARNHRLLNRKLTLVKI